MKIYEITWKSNCPPTRITANTYEWNSRDTALTFTNDDGYTVAIVPLDSIRMLERIFLKGKE